MDHDKELYTMGEVEEMLETRLCPCFDCKERQEVARRKAERRHKWRMRIWKWVKIDIG